MKELLLAFFTFCIAVISQAQIPAGTKLIGGSFGLGYQKSKYLSNSSTGISFNINPTFGKAIKENVVQGVSLSYNYYQTESPNSQEVKTQSAGLNFFRQKYLQLGKSFMAFGEGNIGGRYDWTGEPNYKSYSIVAGLGAGIAYHANSRLLLTLSLPNAISAYLNYNSNETSSIRTSTMNLGLNSRVALQQFQFGLLFMRK